MKWLITAVTLIPLYANANWVQYGAPDKLGIHYYDPSRVKVQNGIVTVWEKAIDQRLDSHSLIRFNIDCKNETVTITYMFMAIEDKAAGTEISPEKWKADPIIPDSPFDFFYQRYCKKAR